MTIALRHGPDGGAEPGERVAEESRAYHGEREELRPDDRQQLGLSGLQWRVLSSSLAALKLLLRLMPKPVLP